MARNRNNLSRLWMPLLHHTNCFPAKNKTKPTGRGGRGIAAVATPHAIFYLPPDWLFLFLSNINDGVCHMAVAQKNSNAKKTKNSQKLHGTIKFVAQHFIEWLGITLMVLWLDTATRCATTNINLPQQVDCCFFADDLSQLEAATRWAIKNFPHQSRLIVVS